MNSHHTSHSTNTDHVNLLKCFSNGPCFRIQLVQVCIIRKCHTLTWRPKPYHINIICPILSNQAKTLKVLIRFKTSNFGEPGVFNAI